MSNEHTPAGGSDEPPQPTTQGGPDSVPRSGPRHRRIIHVVSEPGDGPAVTSTESQRDVVASTSPTTPASPVSPATPTGDGSGPSTTRPTPEGEEYRATSDLRQQERVQGSRPGDSYMRYERNVGAFRRVSAGMLSASIETEEPRTRFGQMFGSVKRVLIGAPLSTEESAHERLTNVKALAVLSSDALSSVAYATEEILRVLIGVTVVGAASAYSYTLPIAMAVMLLLAIVATSYRQTIAAYPKGGGSYIVAKDNLGTIPGLTAAASILIDYTMTVAVSISAGIAAIYSLFPSVQPYRVEICLGVVVLVTIANLRGVREAGNIFAVPTYIFVIGVILLIAYGGLRVFFHVGDPVVYVPPKEVLDFGKDMLSPFLLLRAFTQGCTALTGVEAIADGVPAFQPPESKNARTTLLWMAGLAITMFGGITVLSNQLNLQPSDQETILSQLARTIFGSNILWFGLNFATALILVLAANTAFSDFPRLAYFLARDQFMPHQYSYRGDRLAYSWGIVTLAVMACILIIAFNGDTTALIPLYTVGVFNSFTLSQTGMVVKWWRTRTPGWQRSMAINGAGALATFIVLIMSAVTKFVSGAWIVIALIPILILLFLTINRHYRRVALEVAQADQLYPQPFKHTFIVPVSRLNPITLSALNYARSLSKNVTAVHIAEGEDPEEIDRFNSEWRKALPDSDIALVIIESPFRSLIGPLLSYIDALDKQSPDDTITIVLPEFLPSRPWEYLLHNQSALRLKASLLFRPNTVVADVPYHPMNKRGGSRASEGAWGALRSFPWLPLAFLVTVSLLIYVLFLQR